MKKKTCNVYNFLSFSVKKNKKQIKNYNAIDQHSQETFEDSGECANISSPKYVRELWA